MKRRISTPSISKPPQPTSGFHHEEAVLLTTIEVEAEPKAVNHSPVLAGWGLALALFIFTALNSDHESLEAAASVLGMSILAGTLFWLLLRRDIAPGALMVALLAFAYIPSIWDAVAFGFSRTEFIVTAEGLKLAIIALIGQLLLTSGGAWWGIRTPVLASLVHPQQPILHPDQSERSFLIAFIVFLIACLVSSIIDGQWTAYAPGEKTTDFLASGGFRLALLYPSCLLGASALCGLKLATFRSRNQLWSWLGFTLCVLVLLFLLQGRRFMLASIALMVLPQLGRRAVFGHANALRGMIALMAAGTILAALMYGSLVWRVALRHRSEDAISHFKGMAEADVGANDTIENIRDRLTYLWMDAVALELGSRANSPDLLLAAFKAAVAGNIPGALFPEKYKWESITCDTLFPVRGQTGDLPCTALSEGVLFGGGLGLFCVGACWAFALALASSFYGAGTASGHVLSAVMLTPIITIETSAFPLLQSLRALVLFASFLAVLAWVWHSIENLWRKTHPDVIGKLDENERASRRARRLENMQR
jgi:hypothetical protein